MTARRSDRPPATSTRSRRSAFGVWALPLLVLLGAGILTMLNLNGSSVALISADHASDPAVVAGTPRPIRSDEFLLSTPVEVGNVVKGYPDHTWIGLTDTDLNVTTLGAPTASWLALFQPASWPMFVLDVEHGYAGRWWTVTALPIVGMYFLLLTLRRRPALAATLSVVIGLSPLMAWWSGSPGPIVGFLAASAALVLLAVRARRAWATVVLGLLGGYLACAAFFTFYPPWLVAVGLVMVAVVIGEVIQRRTPIGRVVLAAASASAVLVGVVALWWSQSSAALAAVTGTIYPGNRLSTSNGGIASVLFGTPLNRVFAGRSVHVAWDPRLNQSEVSSTWFPAPVLLLLVALVVITLVRARSARPSVEQPSATAAEARVGDAPRATTGGARDWATFIAVSAVTALELLWMFAPLPSFVGRLTLLDRVPGYRATLGLGVCAVLLVHLVAGRLPAARWWPRAAWAAAAAIATGALAAWAATRLLPPGVPGLRSAVLVGVLVAACFGVLALARTSWPAMVVLVVVVAANYALVNPLYRGLGPLRNGPLAHSLDAFVAKEGPTRWADLTGGTAGTVVTASGEELLSGLTYYPTRDIWERLAPTQEARWNNYSKYVWTQDPTAHPALIEPFRGTNQRLAIDLCSPDVAFLDVRYVVTSTTPPPSCFTPVTTVHDLGQTLVISRRN